METNNKNNKRIIVHIILIAIVVFFIAYIGVRLYRWNKGTIDDTDVSVNNPEFDVEVLDYILPQNPSVLEGREDDGITTVVCIGNNPFSDDRWTDLNLCDLIEKELGGNAKVYNCSFSDSLVASINGSYFSSTPYDAFSFYWVCAAMATGDFSNLDDAYKNLGEESKEKLESINNIKEIDFDKVDVIAIMYNGHDHYCKRPVDDGEEVNIQYYTGALEAGLQLLQNAYPYIRIMVMSPTYEYGVDENGKYIEADMNRNDFGTLSTYVIKESDTCYENSVSFIDNYYGTVNQLNADKYLVDNKKLNEEGKKLVAKRFVECLNKYK